MTTLLFLLLPVAAASGWWLARRRGLPSRLYPDFLRGLDYLLDEQPDKAIDLFLRAVEVDRDTIGMHLALGSLFRRRGEVDRAIRIHRNLTARGDLDPTMRALALHELARDYMNAGLLDRAETLLRELADSDMSRQRALHALLDLYQRESDWPACLEIVERLRTLNGESMTAELAHFRCELAEQARLDGDLEAAQGQLREIVRIAPDFPRAHILLGSMALDRAEFASAAGHFLHLAEAAPTYLPEVIVPLEQALTALPKDDPHTRFAELARRHPGASLQLRLLEMTADRAGSDAALALAADYLRRFADVRVLKHLLALQAGQVSDEAVAARLRLACQAVDSLQLQLPGYRCEQCGFEARLLHWQCPGCRSWDTVLPVQVPHTLSDALLDGPRLA